jgi:hypothetical protein
MDETLWNIYESVPPNSLLVLMCGPNFTHSSQLPEDQQKKLPKTRDPSTIYAPFEAAANKSRFGSLVLIVKK